MATHECILNMGLNDPPGHLHIPWLPDQDTSNFPDSGNTHPLEYLVNFILTYLGRISEHGFQRYDITENCLGLNQSG